mmetsp:Transcript_32387/g.67659  ORF Transcript_32387/g.67659 Transcript_32387/m.67659 type:complete len:80 (-) Transcript_32387:813-1052(-)
MLQQFPKFVAYSCDMVKSTNKNSVVLEHHKACQTWPVFAVPDKLGQISAARPCHQTRLGQAKTGQSRTEQSKTGQFRTG